MRHPTGSHMAAILPPPTWAYRGFREAIPTQGEQETGWGTPGRGAAW